MAEHRLPALWSPEALDDIDHLWDYYARVAGRTTADKIIREIAKIVKTIDDFPYAGRVRDEIQAGLRSLTATPQIVFYRLKMIDPKSYVCSMGGRISRRFSPMAGVADPASRLHMTVLFAAPIGRNLIPPHLVPIFRHQSHLYSLCRKTMALKL